MPHRDHQHIADPPSIITRHPLRFEDGDLIVKLSSNPDEWLLLHAEVLRAASDFFRRGLQPQWGKPKTVQNGAGKDIEVYTMSLVVREGVYFLETGADFDEQECLDTGRFDFVDSEMNEMELLQHSCCRCWGCAPHYSYDFAEDRRELLAATAAEYRAIFAMIYEPLTDRKVLLADLPRRTRASPCCSRTSTQHLANIASIANYHGLFDRVGPALENLLLGIVGIWEVVARDPCEVSSLARVLEIKELYMEGLRHLVADMHQCNYSRDEMSLLALLLECDFEDARSYLELATEAAKKDETALACTLQQLTLGTEDSWPSKVGLFRQLGGVSTMNEEQKHNARIESLAQSIYREWILYYSQDDACRYQWGPLAAESLATGCKKILEAADHGDATVMFDEAIEQQLSLWFTNDGDKTKVEEFLREKLAKLASEAVDEIKRWSSSGGFLEIEWAGTTDWWKPSSTQSITYTKTSYPNDTRLTKMAVRDIAPWEDEQVKPEDRMRGGFSRSIRDLDSEEDMDDLRALAALPNVSINPVSDAWVRALGMIPAPKADFSNSGICFRGQRGMVPV